MYLIDYIISITVGVIIGIVTGSLAVGLFSVIVITTFLALFNIADNVKRLREIAEKESR